MSSTSRLDAFTDSAFAFAATLLVVGASGSAADGGVLRDAVAAIPSIAIGFAIIATFWWSHVRWRGLRGEGDWRSLLLTLLLIFAVLVYIVPLRAMSTSFAAFLLGDPTGYRGSLGQLFTIYGVGFTAMSAITALLFLDARRNPELDAERRREALGQALIWTILAVTGGASASLALVPGFAPIAPFLYATLPISIGIFVSLFRWMPR